MVTSGCLARKASSESEQVSAETTLVKLDSKTFKKLVTPQRTFAVKLFKVVLVVGIFSLWNESLTVEARKRFSARSFQR